MRHIRLLASLLVSSSLPIAAWPQTPQASTPRSESLTLAGSSDRVPVVQTNGKYYVDMESLARLTHGSISFQGGQIVLTLPQAGGASPGHAEKTPQLSGPFLQAEIEALTAIREWRIAIVNAVQNNAPVTDGWVGGLRRSADSKVQLAVAAASTEPDHGAAELLRNEYNNMQQMSDQLLALHVKDSYTPPDSFDSNALDQKILNCGRALGSMAGSRQFQDEASCH